MYFVIMMLSSAFVEKLKLEADWAPNLTSTPGGWLHIFVSKVVSQAKRFEHLEHQAKRATSRRRTTQKGKQISTTRHYYIKVFNQAQAVQQSTAERIGSSTLCI
jgi:hypothetical protein